MDTQQMYTHELNPVKGWWDEHALDKSAVANVSTGGVIYRGMVMSLNASGEFVKGLGVGAMPIFAFNASDDLDAVVETGSMIGPGNGGVSLGANRASMVGVVAIGGYELQSTEYDTDDEASMLPNTPLTSPAPGQADAGLLQVGTFYVDTICGIVSNAGPFNNEAGKSVVQFWGYFLPPMTVAELSQWYYENQA